MCSGRGGATGAGLETGEGVTRLAPPGGKTLAPTGGKVWRWPFSVGGAKGREWRPFLGIGGKSTIANGGSVDLPLLGPGGSGVPVGGPRSEPVLVPLLSGPGIPSRSL